MTPRAVVDREGLCLRRALGPESRYNLLCALRLGLLCHEHRVRRGNGDDVPEPDAYNASPLSLRQPMRIVTLVDKRSRGRYRPMRVGRSCLPDRLPPAEVGPKAGIGRDDKGTRLFYGGVIDRAILD
jgi:hypothetical protein